ncbi:hypothetical protein RD792_011602 [Penstemon davidsonii]|uniref:Exonuclease 1 n=1 Tax=Penstemon davidsonii TaxID=160366 RepID=A0ABR0CZA3_9LAMI|nr:hypothetical protein RD792_011602 [Penstemon davidsonii]
MGIQGLLPLLKSIMTPIHIKEFEGCYVAIDTYSWLHKGALSCSTQLCKSQPTSRHIEYCMHRVNMLRYYGVKPILVFDGGPLPMKSDQEIKRARSRRENLSRAMEHESNGNKSAAYECYQKAVDISPFVAYDLIQVLKQENVSYIVAPYEADAQMTFLALTKKVEAVITEDSDLIVFGCPKIIYKMDKFGQGVEYKNSMLHQNKELNLSGFTQTMLLEMCILSGCDYLQSLPGMGLKKAHSLIKKFKSHEKVIKHLRYNGVEVTPTYEESFKRAILTFRHQRVYDPVKEDIVHLSEPTDAIGDDLEFLGPYPFAIISIVFRKTCPLCFVAKHTLTRITSLPQPVAKGIAQGDLDPLTKLPIQRESDATEKVIHETYQLKNFKPDGERKKLDLPAQRNLLTNYFCIHFYQILPRFVHIFTQFAILGLFRYRFKVPRSTPKHPNESNGASCHHRDVHEAKYGVKIDDLDFPEGRHHDDRGVTDYNEMQSFTSLQSAVCKPCISMNKDLDSDTEITKSKPGGNKNVIVRSSYFLNKPREENKPLSALLEGTSRKEEKRIIVRSSYFQHKENIKQNADSNDCEMTVENRKARVRSSYFKETCVNHNNDPELEGLVTRVSIHGRSPPGDNSLECTMKKRKIVQTETPTEDANDENLISGACTSELEETTRGEEGKFGCNITHLGHYSNIAEKSMDKFVSVISSFRYNSSGSRASGLRAPLKDIKNNCIKRR